MPLKIRPNNIESIPIEVEVFRPDLLSTCPPEQIAQMTVYFGNRKQTVGDHFELSGDASDGHLVLEGDFRRVKWVGQGMKSGRITVCGSVGMHLGAQMQGGEIVVEGDAGDWVGAEMRGGLIQIEGDTGHLAGGSYRGSISGMKGGAIVIKGSAGNEVGCGMRRGLIAIGGKVGDYAGFNMIAGTIVVSGPFGIRCGAGMRRGTIVSLGDEEARPQLLASFRYDCRYQPQFLPIYLRQLIDWRFPIESAALAATYHRHSGDLVALGKGEILIWDRT